jgi:hypothetical protein
MARILPVLLVMFLVCACGIPGHQVAKEGRRTIVGMSADTVQACAGIPTRTKRLDERTEIFSYEFRNENTGGVQVDLPVVGGRNGAADAARPASLEGRHVHDTDRDVPASPFHRRAARVTIVAASSTIGPVGSTTTP